MTMAIELAVSGVGGQSAAAGIFGQAALRLGSNSFAAALSMQLAAPTDSITDRTGKTPASSSELNSSGPLGGGLPGLLGGKQPMKLPGEKQTQQRTSPKSVSSAPAMAASPVISLPATFPPALQAVSIVQQNAAGEHPLLSQAVSSPLVFGNSSPSAMSSLNSGHELSSEPDLSSLSTYALSTAASTVPSGLSVSPANGALTASAGANHTMAVGITAQSEPQVAMSTVLLRQSATQTTIDNLNDSASNFAASATQWAQPAEAMQQNQQLSVRTSFVQIANVTSSPSVTEVTANEVSGSLTDSSSLDLQDSDAKPETSQQSGLTRAASTINSIFSPPSSATGSDVGSASSENVPLTNPAAAAASFPTIALPGGGTPRISLATAAGIPMEGAPAKAVFPGTIVPQGTPRTSGSLTSIAKSVGTGQSVSPAPSDLSTAIQTHVVNTLAGSALELRARATLAVGQSLQGIQPKALPNVLSATSSLFAKTSTTVSPGVNPDGETTVTSGPQIEKPSLGSGAGGEATVSSVRSVPTGKDSGVGATSATVSTADAQGNPVAAIAAQTVTQSNSPQAETAALAVPASVSTVQDSARQPAPVTASLHSANENLPSASSPFSNPAAPGELPSAAVGPVQLAQIASKAAQAEMRIGMNTTAFGSVEVRTTVHANDVGVVIGSEKGDLRSLLTNELPNIANTLEQQNLRLNHVSFQQGGALSGNTFSGNSSPGNGSQQFSSAQTVNYASVGCEIGVDDSMVAMESVSASSTSLSILA